MNTYAVIRRAIVNRQQILATYQGLQRELCPHVLGWKGREAHALFYQFGGQSSRGLDYDGSPNNWRCIRIDELSDVTARSGQWHTASSRLEFQKCVDQIDVEV